MTKLTPDERLVLTRRTMDLLEGWGLGARDITAILQLPDSVKARNVGRFREEEPFPDEPPVNRRVAYLLRIEEALHTYFPRNPEMRNLWVKRGNKQFGRRAPIAVMVEDGESGLISVLSHLELHLRLGPDRLQDRLQRPLTASGSCLYIGCRRWRSRFRAFRSFRIFRHARLALALFLFLGLLCQIALALLERVVGFCHRVPLSGNP